MPTAIGKVQRLTVWAVWLAAMLVIYARAPTLLSEPRFWAEEGAIYFAEAFNRPWYSALLTPHGPYVLLYTNLVAIVVARFVSLAHAPLATTLFAFAVQSIPPAIILWSTSSVWDGMARKLAGVLILLFVPISGEIWLTTTNSQFYFSMVAALILLDDVDTARASAWKILSYRTLLILAGLTGPVSCLLAPVFVLKAWRRRSREAVVQAGILLACVAMQLVVLWVMRHDVTLERRLTLLDVPAVAAVLWTNTLCRAFLSVPLARACARLLFETHSTNPAQFTLLGYLILMAEAGWLCFVAAGVPRQVRWLLVGSYLLLAILSSQLSHGSNADKAALLFPDYGGRYFYAPTVLVLLLPLLNLRRGIGTFRLVFCSLSLATALVLGISEYRPPSASGPPWPVEVARWQNDPQYRLRIWPAGWTMALEKH